MLTRDPEFESRDSDDPHAEDRRQLLSGPTATQGPDLRPPCISCSTRAAANCSATSPAKTSPRRHGGPENTKTTPPPGHHPRRAGDVGADHQLRNPHAGADQRQLHAEGSRSAGQHPPRRPTSRHLKPQPVSESTIAATLGEDTIEGGRAGHLLSFVAVLSSWSSIIALPASSPASP